MQSNKEVGEYELENRQTWNDMLLLYAERHKNMKSEKLEFLFDTVQIHEKMLREIFKKRNNESNCELSFQNEYARYGTLFQRLRFEYSNFSTKFRKYSIMKSDEGVLLGHVRLSTIQVLEDLIWENFKVEACLDQWAANNSANRGQTVQKHKILSSLDLSDETAAKSGLRRGRR